MSTTVEQWHWTWKATRFSKFVQFVYLPTLYKLKVHVDNTPKKTWLFSLKYTKSNGVSPMSKLHTFFPRFTSQMSVWFAPSSVAATNNRSLSNGNNKERDISLLVDVPCNVRNSSVAMCWHVLEFQLKLSSKTTWVGFENEGDWRKDASENWLVMSKLTFIHFPGSEWSISHNSSLCGFHNWIPHMDAANGVIAHVRINFTWYVL